MRAKSLLLTLLYAGAALLGVGSAVWTLKSAPWLGQSVQAGAWKTSLLTGSPDANLYTRASVALHGLLALGRSETLYFVASSDDAGQPLRAACRYRVEGSAPAARWWSITAYADDLFLFDTPTQRYSLNASSAVLDAHQQFAMTTGAAETPGTFWLPTPGTRGLVLTLRLYNPDDSLQSAPQSLVPPRITRLGECA